MRLDKEDSPYKFKILEKEDSQYRFEIRITDLFKMKNWDMTQPAVDHLDVGHVEYVFSMFPERLQEHIVSLSRMFLVAAQPGKVSEAAIEWLLSAVLEWWEDHQFDTQIVCCDGCSDEHNVYDDEPDFVTIAKWVRLTAAPQEATDEPKMNAFCPRGCVTHETCPTCRKPGVEVEHGKEVHFDAATGKIIKTGRKMRRWHCPDCGDSLAVVA